MFSNFIRSLKARRGPAAWIVYRSAHKRPVDAHGLSGSKVSDTTICDRVYLSGFGVKEEIKTSEFTQKGVRLLPAKIGSDHEKWCVRIAEDLILRCVPWARLVITPKLEVLGSNVSKDWTVLAGLASDIDGRDAVYAAYEFSKSYFQATIHHEIFHIAERHMDQAVYDQIIVEFDPYAEQFDGEQYERSKIERIARSYANFACLADEGLPVLVDVNRRDILGVFSCVYTGELANQLRYVKPELFEIS